jgi:hypothetical protein
MPMPVRCFLFPLMVAVFVFGLHARMELYRVGTPTTASKISVEKRSTMDVVSETVSDGLPTVADRLDDRQIARFVDFTLVSSQRLPQVELNLRKPTRLDSRGSTLVLPPPSSLL